MEKMRKAAENLTKAVIVAALHLTVFWGMFSAMGICSLAAANYGEKAGGWILDQLFWIGIVVVAIGLIKCLLAKAWVQAIIILIGGSIILFLIQSRDILSGLGNTIWSTVMQ